MTERKRATITISATQAVRALAEWVNRVEYGGVRVLITRRGRPIAALVTADDLALLEQFDEAA